MGEKIGIGIALISLLIFIGIIIFGVVRRIIYKNKYKLRCANQIKLKRGKLLPIYYLSNSGGKLLLLLIVSIIICIFACMISLKYMMVALPILFASFLPFMIIYLINFDVFDSLMFIKKKVEKKYEMTDEPISSNAIWLSKRDYFQTPTDRDVKNISFFNGHSYINIGAIHFNYKYRIKHKRGRRMSYADLYNIYIEIKLSKDLEKSVYMLNKTYMESINETNSIVPIYNVIPPILFEKTTREHVEKFLNNDIQKCIADLAVKLKKYSIMFSNDKLTLVIHNACWSTFLSRVFTKKKCMNNILNSLEEIINTLEKISHLIDKNSK